MMSFSRLAARSTSTCETPAPMGRAYQVIRRTTHITVSVAEGNGTGKPSRSERRAAAGSTAASEARAKRTAGSKKKAAAKAAEESK